MQQVANEGKSLLIEYGGKSFERIPVKTHIITDKDAVGDVLAKYAKPLLQDGDIVFMSEKAVACTQKRAIRMKDIHPRPLAKFLSKFVYKTPYGIGLGIPETMEMALRECGTIRILFAAFISIIGKLFGKRGWFYIVAGDKARAIDGPCDCTIPPYNEYVVLGPLNPDETAKEAAEKSGCPLFCIVDINDLGGNILGVSKPDIDITFLESVLKDNPLGQSDEQTPLGIIRKAGATTAMESGTDDNMPESNSIKDWLYSHKDDIIADLRRIVKIKSVSDSSSDIKPFGQGCRDVLDEVMALCGEHGFEHKNHEYYCGSASLPGTNGKEIGIWAHLDVVPDAGDWKYPPYGGVVEDGFMYGRGVQDNKSAAIAGLYIMKYMRELKSPIKSGISVFFGCNEECGMDDEKYYIKSREKLPDFSIIPDAVFPVSYGEKGIFSANLVSKPLDIECTGLKAGLVSNMVADTAVIKYNDANGEQKEMKTVGQASHAALPQGSVNAIALLADKLLQTEKLSENDTKTFTLLKNVCEDFTGAPLGIAASHEEYGDLTCIGGKLDLVGGKAALNINIRYPYCEKGGDIAKNIETACARYGFELKDISDDPPCYVSRESDFIKSLSKAFTDAVGKEYPCYIMGGGTYARNLPNAVAFGPEMPGDIRKRPDLPQGHGGVHEPDEALNIEEYLTALEIYISAILSLDKSM